MPRNQATEDLQQKIRFERALMTNLRSLNREITQDNVRFYANNGNGNNAEIYTNRINQMLNTHYRRVGSFFSNRIRPILPNDILATSDEVNLINQSLGQYYATRSQQQASFITQTNQENIDEATLFAQQDAQMRDEVITVQEAAIVMGAFLSRRLIRRITGIANTETQAVAEVAKSTEVEVLTGNRPVISGGRVRTTDVTKQWVTVGDERVRLAHASADFSEVQIDDAFIVGGEQLRYPGDTSLGASLGNVINCRCSSVANEQEVIANRRERGV